MDPKINKMESVVNIVLISSALYDLGFFVERVFRNKHYVTTWKSEGDPSNTHSSVLVDIDLDYYERELGLVVTDKKKPNRITSSFQIVDNKLRIPITTIATSSRTFKSSVFYSSTIKKMLDANILIMFYDKTVMGHAGLHKLIDLYCSYVNEFFKRDSKEKKQPCLLIELIKPDSEYNDISNKDMNIADQIDSFQSLLVCDSNLYHICLEVSSIPPDIYSVIKSLILEVL